ncbi:uncharacterized protein METZ01_LOCUS27080 [marine metagenome]|uniref:Uncharacterized protein n=1 Tax=marine metagenome TaxID=408172 RepID=A0A381Q4F4_9ZZZZ
MAVAVGYGDIGFVRLLKQIQESGGDRAMVLSTARQQVGWQQHRLYCTLATAINANVPESISFRTQLRGRNEMPRPN